MANQEASTNPHGFAGGIELIPETATNMSELTSVKVKWDEGDKIYEKDCTKFKIFEESSGCFEFLDEFRKNDPNTNYDHPSLRKLIRVSDYNNRSAPVDHEVEDCLGFRETPEGQENEYLIKFKGYRIECWLKESFCTNCKEETTGYMRRSAPYKNGKRVMRNDKE